MTRELRSPARATAARFVLVAVAVVLFAAGCYEGSCGGCNARCLPPPECTTDADCVTGFLCNGGDCVLSMTMDASGPASDSMTTATDSAVSGTDAAPATDAAPSGTDASPPPGTDAGSACGLPGDSCTGMPVGTCCPGNFCCCGPGGCICDQC
jgi:hypothetical protein